MIDTPVRVFLADSHRLFVEAISQRLEQDPRFLVTGIASSSAELLDKLERWAPDVLCLDLDLAGNGAFELIESQQKIRPNLRILLLSNQSCGSYLAQAVRLNVAGYLLKTESYQALVQALQDCVAGKKCFSQELLDQLIIDPVTNSVALRDESVWNELTGRQLEVLRHLARGQSVKQIAKEMHLSQKSIDSHKYRIMHKLGIHDRVELALFAIREGITLP